MSIGVVNNSAAGNRALAGRTLTINISGVSPPWRPSPSWPSITLPSSSEQKIIGLHAVFPGDGVGNGGNFLALSCAGAYTVDYGDGTVTSYATGVQANYEFNYNNAALDNTNAPVTLVDNGDLIQCTSHGYNNNDTIQFYNIVNTTGLTEAASYYVINSTTNNFQVSSTLGGPAVSLTTNGTAALLPHKISIVTITPQAGQNLTNFNFNLRHTSASLSSYTSGWIDLAIAGPQLTTATLGLETNLVRLDLIQRFRCSSLGTVNSMASFFSQCVGLKSVSLDGISSVANMSSMFSGCSSLTSVPLFNTAAVTNMSSMFSNCFALNSVPLFNTASVTTMASMFVDCSSLTAVPLFRTNLVSTMAAMFSGCSALTSVPLFNTISVGSMSTMFSGCSALTSVPFFNTAAVTSMSNMFNNCSDLISVPLFNTATVINMASMFNGCSSLTSIPPFRTNVASAMNSMFSGCSSLTSVPLLISTGVTTMAGMFSGCSSLTSVPALNASTVSSSTNLNITFSNCFNLSRIRVTGIRFSFSVASCKLSATALDEIFTNLPTTTGQTITITNNYGAATCTRSIATAKGWTVTG